jgi:hypothetical protein
VAMASLHWYQIGTSVPKHKVDKVQIVTYQATMAKDKVTDKSHKQDKQGTSSARHTAHMAGGVRGKVLPVLNRDSKKRGVKRGQRGVC